MFKLALVVFVFQGVIPTAPTATFSSTPSQEKCMIPDFPPQPIAGSNSGNKGSSYDDDYDLPKPVTFPPTLPPTTRPARGDDDANPWANRRRRPERSADQPTGTDDEEVAGEDEAPVSRNIIAGEPANPKEWPFLVTILRKGRTLEYDGEKWDVACGGTLIHPRFVLTAAHCFMRKGLFMNYYVDEANFAVRIGDYSLLVPNISTAVTAKVADYIPHPAFDFDRVSRGNDLAVVMLDKPVILNSYAQPACLPPKSSEQIPANQPCMAAGRGAIVRDGSKISSYPRQTTLWISDEESCTSSLRIPLVAQDGKVFCAGDPKGLSDTCSGDSGGPLVCLNPNDNNWVLSGIVSFGVAGCGLYGTPGAYTSISYYTTWINDTMKRLATEPPKTTTTLRPGTGRVSPPLVSGGSASGGGSSVGRLDDLLSNVLIRIILGGNDKNNATIAKPANNTAVAAPSGSNNRRGGGQVSIIRLNRTVSYSGGTSTQRISRVIIPGGGHEEDFLFDLFP